MSILTALFFPLFLLVIQPHRVHHFFDDLHQSHCDSGTDGKACPHDSKQKLPAQTQCAIQSSAQNSHLRHVPFVDIAVVEAPFDFADNNLISRIQRFSFPPFLGRAPPASSLLLES